MADSSTTVQQAGSGLTITIAWDASVANAPAGFKPAVLDAVQFYESQFDNPIHITIGVGYGEIDGSSLSGGAVGESLTYGATYGYGAVRAALAQNATSAEQAQAVATLPAGDPTGGGFFVATAEAKALGLIADSTRIDGYVGFSADTSYTYDPNNRAVPGQVDFIGVAEHEIAEVMGRQAGLGQGGAYTVQDLFRYSAPGARQLTAGQPAYFSIDGGASALDNFNAAAGADYGDWAQSAGNDAYDAAVNVGVANTVGAADLTEMNVLGYQRTGAAPAPSPAPPPVAAGNVIFGVHDATVVLDDPAVQNPATVSAAGVVSVSGGDGIDGAAGYAWNLTNLGAIASTATGVALASGGAVANEGTITGYNAGVAIYGGAGTLTNQGTISAGDAAGAGVILGGSGSLLENAGTIADPGGLAVYFAGGGDSLIVDPGAAFTGAVAAGGSGNGIELAAGSTPGRLSGLGTRFTGFSGLTVDPGAAWRLSGAERALSVVNDGTITVEGGSLVVGAVASDPGSSGTLDIGRGGAAGLTRAAAGERVAFTAAGGRLRLFQPLQFLGAILGFGRREAIDLAGRQADTASFADHHLTVSNAGTVIADLHLAGGYASGDFAISPDGHGGTDITFAPGTAAALLARA